MFLSTNKKVTGVWNSEVGSRKANGESRGHPISPVKYNLYFHCSENTAFYIFTTVKYSFFKICIIFNQYFSVFHYFVYNKRDQLTAQWLSDRVLDWGKRVASSKLTGGTVLFPWARHVIIFLVIVQHNKTGKPPDMTEKCWLGRQTSTQTIKTIIHIKMKRKLTNKISSI